MTGEGAGYRLRVPPGGGEAGGRRGERAGRGGLAGRRPPQNVLQGNIHTIHEETEYMYASRRDPG